MVFLSSYPWGEKKGGGGWRKRSPAVDEMGVIGGSVTFGGNWCLILVFMELLVSSGYID